MMDIGKEFHNVKACTVKDFSKNIVVWLGTIGSKDSDNLKDLSECHRGIQNVPFSKVE